MLVRIADLEGETTYPMPAQTISQSRLGLLHACLVPGAGHVLVWGEQDLSRDTSTRDSGLGSMWDHGAPHYCCQNCQIMECDREFRCDSNHRLSSIIF
ncbi:hypothetical protein RRG08_058734 [Elysia crispata]|uniref:Uncharacterized protein n=1 Tax=Elysia crispata TaxID=231223 RepID=A0AAE0YW98_9GAST|nr:hypothetical protein RRG08_058734 [Elysia crispata]